MSRRTHRYGRSAIAREFRSFGIVLAAAVLLAQSKSPGPGQSGALEMPVTLRQNVVAGQTAVGTAVQAKLTLATLVNGTVIPQNAVLTGEVIESAAKSAAAPSRLAIRMDSWKVGSKGTSTALPFKIYLTEWFYAVEMPMAQEAGDASVPRRTKPQYIGGAAPYPDPNTSDSPGYSRGNTDRIEKSIPSAPLPGASRRTQLKYVESTRGGDGRVTIISSHSNIKLDKSTTYILSTR